MTLKSDTITINELLYVLPLLQDWFKHPPITQEMRDTQFRHILVEQIENQYPNYIIPPLLSTATLEEIQLHQLCLHGQNQQIFFKQQLIHVLEKTLITQERALLMSDLRKSQRVQ